MITSVRNAKIVEVRKLQSAKQRKRQGRFWVEGLQLLYMALEAGLYPEQVFWCEALCQGDGAQALVLAFERAGCESVEVSEHVMRTLSDRDTPQGIAAAFKSFDCPLEELQASKNDLVLVLEAIQNPGNLGTLIRTADAVGAVAVVVIEPAVDSFDPKVIRGSMGSIFNVPVVRIADIKLVTDWLKEQGLPLVGADPHLGVDWGEGVLDAGVALVLGNEARGLSPTMHAAINHFARLPMVGKAESLNVAVAGSVFMYAWLRVQENGPKSDGTDSC